MPNKREVREQQTEVDRLAVAVRDLRMAQLKSNDPKQVERLGQALKVMKDRAELASLGLAKVSSATGGGTAAAGLQVAVNSLKQAVMVPQTALLGMASAASGVVGMFDRIGSTFGRFVEASNPAEMIRFNIAVKDLAAAFGKIFEPVILVATEFANILNQFVTSLQPVLGPVVQLLVGAFMEIAKAVLDMVAPIIESLIPVFRTLAEFILPPIVTVFRALSDAIRAVINWIRSWLGMSPLAEGRASERGGVRTVAAQQARQIGIEQIGEQARASAFGGASIAQQQLSAQERANRFLQEELVELRRIAETLDDQAPTIARMIRVSANVAAGSAAAINGMAGVSP